MKYEDVNLLENGLKAMLDDEEKGIKEYEKRAIEAADMGAFNTALMYRDIWKQEKEHAQKLRERIAEAELVKYGRVPGEDLGMVMEPRRMGREKKIPQSPETQRLQRELYRVQMGFPGAQITGPAGRKSR